MKVFNINDERGKHLPKTWTDYVKWLKERAYRIKKWATEAEAVAERKRLNDKVLYACGLHPSQIKRNPNV